MKLIYQIKRIIIINKQREDQTYKNKYEIGSSGIQTIEVKSKAEFKTVCQRLLGDNVKDWTFNKRLDDGIDQTNTVQFYKPCKEGYKEVG